jgi:hypothetical protein
MTTITTNIVACARCGGDHSQVTFTAFGRAPVDATHWGTCEATGEPILMVVRQVLPAPTQAVQEPAGFKRG